MNKHYTHLPDPDLDPRPRHRTIRSVLDGADLHTLSDGEFDVRYLKKYPHRSQLDDCCSMAVKELGDELFAGRQSCARVMGRAMELLRETYGLDAPRGWVPVLRNLRAKEGSVQSRQQTDRGLELPRAEPEVVIPPQEILTHHWSAIVAFESGRQMARFVAENKDLQTRFVELAEKVGVPTCWEEALSFLELLTDQLDEVPEPLSRRLIELRQNVAGPDWPRTAEV